MVALNGDPLKLVEAIAKLDTHDHVCLIYEDTAEQFAAIAPYVRFGLERGQRCLYIADDLTAPEVLDALRRGGVPVEEAVARRALILDTARGAGLDADLADHEALFRLFDVAIEKAKAAGFNGLRLAIEMTWVNDDETRAQRLIQFETRLNAYLPQHNCMAIGLYNRRRFSAPLIRDVIRTHPLVISSGIACRNFFYTPPEQFLAQQPEEDEVDRMLHQLVKMEKVETALRESEQHYRDLFEHLPTPAFTKDVNGVYTGCNSENLKYWYVDPVGHTDAELQSQSVAARLRAHDLQVLQTGEGIIVEEHFPSTPVGDRRLITRKEPILNADGVIIGVLGTCIDITDRVRAEHALRESKEMFQNIVRHSSSMFYTHTPDNVLTYVSPQARQILGCEPEEAMVRWQEFLSDHPINQAGIEATERAIATGIRQPPYELELITRRGRRIWVQVDESPMVQDGKTTGIVGSVSDITLRKQREREMEALALVSAALRTAVTRADMLPIILGQITTLLDADSAGLARLDPERGEALIEMSYGTNHLGAGPPVPLGQGIIGGVLATGKPYLSHPSRINQATLIPGVDPTQPAVSCVPLLVENKVIGAVWIGRQKKIDKADVRLQTAIADITANALQRESLHEQTRGYAQRLSDAYESTLEGWARALELRDRETKGHTQRVTEITLRLGRAIGIHGEELDHIRRGALLHDIGKMGIPDSILLKPGALNEQEWEVMRKHPQYALEMLSPIEHLRPALDIPYCHHEKWDGSGYPRGLKGEQIPLAARLFAIADVWDALNSNRPYRRAWSEAQSVDYIRVQAGSHFEPAIVDLFFKVMGYPRLANLTHTGKLRPAQGMLAAIGQD